MAPSTTTSSILAPKWALPPAGPELGPETRQEISIQKRQGSRRMKEGKSRQQAWQCVGSGASALSSSECHSRSPLGSGSSGVEAAHPSLLPRFSSGRDSRGEGNSGSSNIAALQESGIRLGRGFPTLTHAAKPLARLELLVTNEPQGQGPVLSSPSLPFLREHPKSLRWHRAAPSLRAPPRFAGVTSKSV